MADAVTEPLGHLEFLLGTWEGDEVGTRGLGMSRRSYARLFGRFIEARTVTEHEAQSGDSGLEVREELAILSAYGRQTRLREWHSEGIMIGYRAVAAPLGMYAFLSERIENGSTGMRARRILRPLDDDRFEETFELSARDTPFDMQAKSLWRRAR